MTLVVAVLIFAVPITIYYIVYYFQELAVYDNHIIGQCEWNGTSSGVQDCQLTDKGQSDGYNTRYYYNSDECDYTLSYETECRPDAPLSPHQDGTCYILKCEGEGNTEMTWISQQNMELNIIICFIALFVEILLLAYHVFAYKYYKRILDKRKEQQQEPTTSIQASSYRPTNAADIQGMEF